MAGGPPVTPRSVLRLGIARRDLDDAIAGAGDAGREARHRRDRVTERDVRAMGHVEHELAFGAGRDGDAPARRRAGRGVA